MGLCYSVLFVLKSLVVEALPHVSDSSGMSEQHVHCYKRQLLHAPGCADCHWVGAPTWSP